MRKLYVLLFCLPLFAYGQKDVTFIVDMRDYTGSYTSVYVNGDFNNWCGSCNVMSDPEGDSIWTATLPLTSDSIEYKFTLDGWTGQEALTSGTTCTKTTGIYTNRFAVLNGDTILNGVAWESCDARAGTIYCTYQVNMNNETVDSTGVFLAGGAAFGTPGSNPMTHVGDSMYSITLPKDTGFTSMYVFINGNDPGWGGKENLAGKPCAAGTWNDRDMGAAWYTDYRMRSCFGECTTDGDCPSPAMNYNVTFQVDMSPIMGTFTTAYISGSLNGWSGNANALTDADGDSVYEATLSLAPGVYEYKFTYDDWAGQEAFDPATDDSLCTITTGIYTNRVVTIGSADTVLAAPCWETCAPCSGVGVDEFGTTWTVMPNPAQNVLTVDVSGSAQVEIRNALGQLVYVAQVNDEARIDVSTLPRGMYIIRVANENIDESQRVVLN